MASQCKLKQRSFSFAYQRTIISFIIEKYFYTLHLNASTLISSFNFNQIDTRNLSQVSHKNRSKPWFRSYESREETSFIYIVMQSTDSSTDAHLRNLSNWCTEWLVVQVFARRFRRSNSPGPFSVKRYCARGFNMAVLPWRRNKYKLSFTCDFDHHVSVWFFSDAKSHEEFEFRYKSNESIILFTALGSFPDLWEVKLWWSCSNECSLTHK